MPITYMLDMLTVDDPYLKSIDRSDFIYSTAYILGFGMEGPIPEEHKDMSWGYFPDDNVPFYRITWLHNYSPKVVPDIEKNWSLLLEVNINSMGDITEKYH